MKNWLRVTICVALVVSILAMSLSVFADEEENPLMTANDQTVAFLIWQLLQSWGIDVQFDNISEYTIEVQNEIQNWIWDYLDEQPSIESVLAWIADWYFMTDFWGNLVVNQSLLDDVQAFADWLEIKFNLSDNSEVIVNPEYTFGGYTLYETNKWYSISPLNTSYVDDSNGLINIRTPNGEHLYYTFVYWPDGVTILYLENHNWYAILDWYASDNFVMDNSTKTMQQNISYWKVNQKGVYWNNIDLTGNNWAWTVTGGHMMFVDDSDEFSEFMAVAEIQQEGMSVY